MDAAGQKITDKITALPRTDSAFKKFSVKQYPPLDGKDWNDTLQSILQKKREQNRTNIKQKGGDAI